MCWCQLNILDHQLSVPLPLMHQSTDTETLSDLLKLGFMYSLSYSRPPCCWVSCAFNTLKCTIAFTSEYDMILLSVRNGFKAIFWCPLCSTHACPWWTTPEIPPIPCSPSFVLRYLGWNKIWFFSPLRWHLSPWTKRLCSKFTVAQWYIQLVHWGSQARYQPTHSHAPHRYLCNWSQSQGV